MPSARHTALKWLAAAVWYVGAAVLLWKGAERLLTAAAQLPSLQWPVAAAALGVGLGILQGRTLFRAACARNLRRIEGLEEPRFWQFFRAGFFVALAGMIGLAVLLGVLAGYGPGAAAAVGAVDWAVGFSLLISSAEFWSRRAAKPARREAGA